MLTPIAAVLTTLCSLLLQPELVHTEQLEQGFVVVVDDIARVASPDRPMYLASNHGGWDPANPDFLMSQRSDGKWQLVFDKPERTGTIQFKFTLGSWDYVETDPDGMDIENRTLPKVDPATLASGERPVFEFRIPRFRSPSDIASGRQNTQYRDWDVTGNLKRLQVSGGAGEAAGVMRDLLIWLPPGYDEPENADRHYPVLYLFDGQNVFEKQDVPPSEWHADETATRLIASGEVTPFIIVGVPHAGAARIQEYTPAAAMKNLGKRWQTEAAGEAFIKWFTSTVMPRVERAVRARSGPEFTGVGGASLGATIALAMTERHPERFGLLLLESIAAIGDDTAIPRYQAGKHEMRVFIGVGDHEMGEAPNVARRNRELADQSRNLALRLADQIGDDRVHFVLEAGAVHDESSWARRLPDALRFLFPRTVP